MKNNKVAVLLSSFNGSRYIQEQINSILEQKKVDITLYIRDDNSTDNTIEIIRSINDSRIRLIKAKENVGALMSFSKLIQKCPRDYDYYAFADQDDIWLKEKLFAGIDNISKICSHPAMYCTALLVSDEKANPSKHIFFGSSSEGDHLPLVFQNYATGNTILLNSHAFELLQAAPPNKMSYMHDWWTLLVMKANSVKIYYDHNSYIKYRQHENNEIGMQFGLKSKLTNILYIRKRIISCLQQIESLTKAPNNWTNSRLVDDYKLILRSRASIGSRLTAIAKGKIKGRTKISTAAFSIAYLIFG